VQRTRELRGRAVGNVANKGAKTEKLTLWNGVGNILREPEAALAGGLSPNSCLTSVEARSSCV